MLTQRTGGTDETPVRMDGGPKRRKDSPSAETSATYRNPVPDNLGSLYRPGTNAGDPGDASSQPHCRDPGVDTEHPDYGSHGEPDSTGANGKHSTDTGTAICSVPGTVARTRHRP